MTIVNTGTFCDWRSLRQISRGPINYREEEKKILDAVLGKDVYDNRIRPSGSNGTDTATLIIVNLFIRSFAKIDDVKMVSYIYIYKYIYIYIYMCVYGRRWGRR